MSKYKAYSYPRVNTSVTALEHVSGVPAAEDTTVLFVPFLAEKGPINTIEKIHSLEEFQATYGEIRNYVDRIGKLTAFNIMNWLSAGGTIYACRLGTTNAKVAKFSFGDYEITGKEKGNYLNDLKLSMSGEYIIVKENSSVVERIYVKLPTEVDEEIALKSEYFNSLKKVNGDHNADASIVDNEEGTDGYDSNTDIKTFYNALISFWTDGTTKKYIESETQESLPNINASNVIGNPLETPIDLIMDAGYPSSIKKAMMKFIADNDANGNERSANDEPKRSDIRGYFDIFDDTSTTKLNASETESAINDFNKDPNIFVYSQSIQVVDGIFSNDEVTVGPTYFLSQMIPANDINNGMQFPVAGLRRAELENVKSISWNPMPDEKEKLFKARINYIEKDSRGYYFMSERTLEPASSSGNNTALTFIHNSRVVCRMVHELERLGRNYLFEFNDAITLSNMTSVLNKYLSTWIANRTLSYGEVTVQKNQYSDEAVDVSLAIKFTGTIEVISIDIVIQ